MTSERALFGGRIGLGTWKMGERRGARAQEVAAVSRALQMGYRLIDTAELYASGEAECIVGAAVAQSPGIPRAELCIVSKVLPNNASRRGTIQACEASLQRLGCAYLDVYLLHWRGSHPFTATLEGFAELQQQGLIREFGVSNLDLDDMQEWRAAERAVGIGRPARVNQLHYSLEERGIEFNLLPWQAARGIATMAYTPLGSGRLTHHTALQALAQTRSLTAAQLALAWTIRQPEVVAIPKSSDPQRLAENLAAASITLNEAELAALDRSFPPPRKAQPLAMV